MTMPGVAMGGPMASLATVRHCLAENYRHRDGSRLTDQDAAALALRRIMLIEHGVRRLSRAHDVAHEIAQLERLIPDTADIDDEW
jgi:hypothetical protein